MSEQKQVVYVPGSSAKQLTTSFGEVIRVSFKVEDLGKFCKEHKNEKGYINFEVAPRKTPSQYGDTHSVKLDSWEPKPKDGQAAATSAPAKTTNAPEKTTVAPDDIPF